MSGVTLANLRERKNITQRELAKMVNVTASAIAMYETGERTPSLAKAKEIARFFKVPVEAIIFGNVVREMRAKDQSLAPDEQAATVESDPKPAA